MHHVIVMTSLYPSFFVIQYFNAITNRCHGLPWLARPRHYWQDCPTASRRLEELGCYSCRCLCMRDQQVMLQPIQFLDIPCRVSRLVMNHYESLQPQQKQTNDLFLGFCTINTMGQACKLYENPRTWHHNPKKKQHTFLGTNISPSNSRHFWVDVFFPAFPRWDMWSNSSGVEDFF